jgi:Fic family protein
MPLVSGSIPNLINGVSQQPAPIRLPSQCKEQINGYSSEEAVRELMPAFFDLLRDESEPAVRVVLGHFVFVYIYYSGV